MSDQETKTVEVKILKQVGEWHAGEVVSMTEEMAKHVADGVKGMRISEYAAHQAKQNDVTGMTVAEMKAKNMKNVVVDKESMEHDHAFNAAAEQAALNGKPIAAAPGEHVVTGGVTPPATVFPAMAKAMGQDVSAVPSEDELKKSSKSMKSPEAPKAPVAPVQPEVKK